MDGKPVDTADTNAPQTTPPEQATAPEQATPTPKGKKGKFGSYTAEARKDVKRHIPPSPETPFRTLHGMLVPNPQDFFTFFERPLLKRPTEDVIRSLTDFNHQFLGKMGFPDEVIPFLNNWALTDAGFASIQEQESEQLLKEAEELIKLAPDDAVHEKVKQHANGKTLSIIPSDKHSSKTFGNLWSFFEQLLTSPFTILSERKDQAEFNHNLEILSQRVHGIQPRRVSQTEPDASIKPKQ